MNKETHARAEREGSPAVPSDGVSENERTIREGAEPEVAIVRFARKSVNPSLLRRYYRESNSGRLVYPGAKEVDGDPGQVELPASEKLCLRNIASSAGASIRCGCGYAYTY